MTDVRPPEKITIIEGPTPTFEVPSESWALSFSESPSMPRVALTRLRTFNGPSLVERCWKAWNSGRGCLLEYRDEQGLTREAPIVAARYVETGDGHVLLLHVRVG